MWHFLGPGFLSACVIDMAWPHFLSCMCDAGSASSRSNNLGVKLRSRAPRGRRVGGKRGRRGRYSTVAGRHVEMFRLLLLYVIISSSSSIIINKNSE